MLKTKTGFILAFAVLLASATALRAENPERSVIISIAKSISLADKIDALDLDLLGEWNGKVYVLAGPTDLEKLEKENVAYIPETPRSYPPSSPVLFPQGGINGAYHSYLELETDMLVLQQKYPNIVKVFDIGDSLEKRNIYAMKISDNVALEEDEAEVLFLGCHHAREWISVEVPFLLGKYLAENYATDPDIKRLVDQSEIWIVPLVNPDGLEYTIHVYRYWRKNRRDNGKSNFGVDINRNYGYKWGIDNAGSSPNPASEVYRGTAAFSEPETRAVRDLFLSKDFQAMISFHSFSQVILYPWGYTKLPSDKDAQMKEIAAEMSAKIQAVNGRLYDYGQSGTSLYLTNGDVTDWTFAMTGIPSYTIELPPIDELGGGFFNRQEDIDPVFRENLAAMTSLIEHSIQNYLPVVSNPFDLRTNISKIFKKD
jgi:murein tripeptide amidase MpaA